MFYVCAPASVFVWLVSPVTELHVHVVHTWHRGKFVLIVTNYVVALKRGNATGNNNTDTERAAAGAAV